MTSQQNCLIREFWTKCHISSRIIYIFISAMIFLSSFSSASLNTVSSQNSFFDVSLVIPENYEKISSGSDLLTNIKILNRGNWGRIDVILDYSILDPDRKEILSKKETVAVETQANFIRTFKIPDGAKSGIYTASVKLSYQDNVAESESSFEVNSFFMNRYIFYFAAAFFIFLLFLFLYPKIMEIASSISLKFRIRRIVRQRLG